MVGVKRCGCDGSYHDREIYRGAVACPAGGRTHITYFAETDRKAFVVLVSNPGFCSRAVWLNRNSNKDTLLGVLRTNG